MKNRIEIVLVSAVMVFLLAPVISQAASFFFVDDTGNVGIGNSTPQHRLDVSGAMYSRLVTVSDAASTTINWNSGNVQAVVLNTSDTMFAFSNGQAGGEYKLILNQDTTGGRVVDWPASVKWPGGTAPTLTAAASSTDVVSFVFDGSSYLGSYVLNLKTPPAPPTIIFSDDFNRANGSIGNGWSTNCQGSGATIGIVSNHLAMSGTSSGDCEFYRTDVSQTSGISLVTEFSGSDMAGADGSGSRGYGIKGTVPGSYGGLFNGYGFSFDNTGNIGINDNGTSKASGTYSSFNGTDHFKIELDITAAPQNWAYLYIWDSTTGSKPGTPTLSWTNGGSNYSPSASGTALYGNFAANTAGTQTLSQYLYEVDTY